MMKNKAIQTRPEKFGKPRLVIIGCGDVGRRLLPLLHERFRVFAVTSQPARSAELRAAGAVPVVANLDDRLSLRKLAGLASVFIHLAPPPSEGQKDRHTRNLTAILPEQAALVYVSTTGVYGNGGEVKFDETRPVNPQNPRAKRRVDAEKVLRGWARRSHSRLAILRVPGIYADNRLPIERLQKGTPAIIAEEDSYTNHIHADDLARIVHAALFHGLPNRVYHAVDDSDMKMGDYFDAVADAFGMSCPPRLPRANLREVVSPVLWSFMAESRRLQNRRMKKELRVKLRHPTVKDALERIKELKRA
jgi:nucleoside-diphosphate-sugar epimerase